MLYWSFFKTINKCYILYLYACASSWLYCKEDFPKWTVTLLYWNTRYQSNPRFSKVAFIKILKPTASKTTILAATNSSYLLVLLLKDLYFILSFTSYSWRMLTKRYVIACLMYSFHNRSFYNLMTMHSENKLTGNL